MKTRTLIFLMTLEAIVCILITFLIKSSTDFPAMIAAFPLKQLGWLLFQLSSLNNFGNAFALLLYTAFCLAPVFAYLLCKGKRRFAPEDSLLFFLSAGLFVTLYFLINPSLLGTITLIDLGDSGDTVLIFILCSLQWFLLAGYLILRLLRLAFTQTTEKLLIYMKLILSCLCFVFVFAAFSVDFHQLLLSLYSLQDNALRETYSIVPSCIFYILRYLTELIPLLLYCILIIQTIKLLTAMQNDRYASETEEQIKKLSLWCSGSLAAVIISSLLFNILQLIFARKLFNISATIDFPIFSLLFVLLLALMTRIFSETRKIKKDNDLFI